MVKNVWDVFWFKIHLVSGKEHWDCPIPVTAAATHAASPKAGSHFTDRRMPRGVTDPQVSHSIPELQTARLSPKIACQGHAQTAKSKPEPKLSSLQVLTLPCNITGCLAPWLVDLLQVCSDLTERAISKHNDKAPQQLLLLGAARADNQVGRTRLSNAFTEESTHGFISFPPPTFFKCLSSFLSQTV